MSLPTKARPMGVGELLDATVRLYRRRFWRLLAIAAIGQLPLAAPQLLLMFRVQQEVGGAGFVVSPITMTVVSLLTQLLIEPLIRFAPFPDGINLLARSAPMLLLCGAQYFIVQSLVTGALTSAMVREPTARPPSVFGAYRLGGRRAAALVLAGLAPLAIGGLGALLVYPFHGTWMLYAGFIDLDNMIVGLWTLDYIAEYPTVLIQLLPGLLTLLLYARLVLAPQITFLEELGPLASLRRSWKLTGGATWRTLALLFVVGLLTFLMVMLPVFAVQVVDIVFSRLNLPLWVSFSKILGVLLIITILLSLVLVLVLQIAAQTLLYFDLRMRRDGYDLELRAGQAATLQP